MSGVILEADDLHLRFGGVQAANGASLKVAANERIAIIGPNGAGKTTFINLCTGYLKPQSGRVVFNGQDVTRLSPQAITRLGIGRSFQIPQLFLDNSVIENLLLALSAREGSWSPFLAMQRHPKAQEMWALLEMVGLKETGNRIVRELPEGMRKLIDIAVALALEPKLIFMDEPTSGVSSTEKFQVMDTLTRVLDVRATTAVFVEHDMDVVARYANRVAVWTGGRIAHQGTPEEILSHPEVRETVIGVGV